MSLNYPHLFTPLKLGGTLFRNRIFASPQGFYNLGADCLPNREEAAFYGRKAQGGAASVCVGDCIVDVDTGRHYPFLCDMKNPDTLPGLSAVASAISRHGAVASAELSHAGMYAQDSFQRTGKLYGPVAMEGKYGPVDEMPEEMILALAEAYGQAAAWAKRCGFGMVTIHGGHGWLLGQFFSPVLNTRKDRWGGSLENRLRFPLAVVERVRAAVGPRFPIEYRLSGSECIDHGSTLEDGIQLARALDGKVDLIHVSAGHHEDPAAMVITHPSTFLPDGCNVRYAAAIKTQVSTPVATVGAFTTPEEMEEVIASGQADVVELGRQSLADPDLPWKARAGQSGSIRRCIRCNTCFGGGGEHRIFECALNPEIGHELEYAALPPARAAKKVLVIGGGVGGMEAALTAARRGHHVILAEQSDRLGGALRCEARVPFKQNMIAYLDQQADLLQKAGVDIWLNTKATPQMVRSLVPDAVITALGARPVVPKIPGIQLPHVHGAEEVYLSPETARDRVVILGGGLVGVELAIFLAGMGRTVSIVEMAPQLTVHPYSMHTLALHDQIAKLGIQVSLSTRAREITEAGVEAEGPDGPRFFPADTVIFAVGQAPLQEEAAAFHDCAPEFYQLGDCAAPKNIHAATSAARRAACDIGRSTDW